VREGDGPFDLAVIDLQVQTPGAVVLAAELQRHQPGLPVLFTTSGAPDAPLGPVLPKPFTLEALARCVRECVETGTCSDCHCPVRIARCTEGRKRPA